MNGLATQTSPSRPPKRRGRAGGSGSRSSRGASGRSRGRGAGGLGSSKLASAKPINQADLSSSSPLLSDAEDTSYEWESTDEYGSSRRERFNKVDPSNRYEQVSPFTLRNRTGLLYNSSRLNAKQREGLLLNRVS